MEEINFSHRPVLLEECMEALAIRPDGVYVDGTAGGAGHSSEIASRLGEGGRLLALDQDATAVAVATQRLSVYGERAQVIRSNFCQVEEVCRSLGISEIDGMLIILNTVGGDVEAGLAIAEMIASLSKPTVSLVLGGSHSIGVPIAVSTNYSFVVKTGTMVIHPVRLNGMIIGVAQTFDYFKQIQDRITGFVSDHSKIKEERFLELMMETKMLTKDVGTVLVGEEIVKEGIAKIILIGSDADIKASGSTADLSGVNRIKIKCFYNIVYTAFNFSFLVCIFYS